MFDGVGEIDFICADPLTTPFAQPREVLGRRALVETAEQIVAKKIVHRGGHMQPRDMFDIAAAVRHRGEASLVTALAPYRDRCEAALASAERFSAEGAVMAMRQLAIRPGFEELPARARQDTIDLLRAVLSA